ncbi:MAG: hypothetical protein BBJ57_11165 [Desulfobacterales bacterium PC51MH44]|nr:MAG: hypothetical protein BBJ57_11165 [Desulfobacterales bacterium PC51MH44]
MFKFFEKQSYLVILLVMGILLIVFSIFDVKDISKLQVAPRSSIVWIGVLIGVAFTGFSLFFYGQDRLTLGWFQSTSVHLKKDRLQTNCKHTQVNIIFGQIQEVAIDMPKSMIVLPANEYFDDECIHDAKSSLGAYVNSVFPNLANDVQALIKEELVSAKSKKMEKEPGVTQASYGIGFGVFLKEPLHSKQPVLFLSVTTKRAGEGLRAEMSHIFEAVKKIQEVAADNRIESVCIPIMGTGHGGLRKEVGLFALVLAICDGVSKPSGHHLKKYNIVVYRASPKESPSVSINASKRILKTAIGLFT